MNSSLKQLFGFAVLAVFASNSRGESNAQDQLPDWARTKWASLVEVSALEVSTRLNPFTWPGDFDGDGRLDFALLVRSMASNKEGIAIIFQAATKPVVLGAGVSFGNGGDDFSWLDLWGVVEADGARQSPTTRGADGLRVAKQESASALIFIEDGKAIWQQEGD